MTSLFQSLRNSEFSLESSTITCELTISVPPSGLKRQRPPSSRDNSVRDSSCLETSSAGKESYRTPNYERSPSPRCSIGICCRRCVFARPLMLSPRPILSSTRCPECGSSRIVNCCRTWSCLRPSWSTLHHSWSPTTQCICKERGREIRTIVGVFTNGISSFLFLGSQLKRYWKSYRHCTRPCKVKRRWTRILNSSSSM